jgi:hypothetical protein
MGARKTGRTGGWPRRRKRKVAEQKKKQDK